VAGCVLCLPPGDDEEREREQEHQIQVHRERSRSRSPDVGPGPSKVKKNEQKFHQVCVKCLQIPNLPDLNHECSLRRDVVVNNFIRTKNILVREQGDYKLNESILNAMMSKFADQHGRDDQDIYLKRAKGFGK